MRFRNFIKDSFPLLEMGHRFSPQNDRGWEWQLNAGSKNLLSLIIGSRTTQALALKWIMWQGLVAASKQRDELVERINASGKLLHKIVPVDLFSPEAHQRNGGELGRLWETEIKHQWQEPQEMILDDGTRVLINKINDKLSKLGLKPFHYGGPDGLMQFIEKANFSDKLSNVDPNDQQGPDLSGGRFVQLGNDAIVPKFEGFTPPNSTRGYQYILEKAHSDATRIDPNILEKYKNLLSEKTVKTPLTRKSGLHDKNANEQLGYHTHEEVQKQLEIIKKGMENEVLTTSRELVPGTERVNTGIINSRGEKSYRFSKSQIEDFIKFITTPTKQQIEKFDLEKEGPWPLRIYRNRANNPCIIPTKEQPVNRITPKRFFDEGLKVSGEKKHVMEKLWSLKGDKSQDYIFTPQYELSKNPPKSIKELIDFNNNRVQNSENGSQERFKVDKSVDENGNENGVSITNGYERIRLQETEKGSGLFVPMVLNQNQPYVPKKGDLTAWFPEDDEFVISGRANTTGVASPHQAPLRNKKDIDAIIEDMKMHPQDWGEPNSDLSTKKAASMAINLISSKTSIPTANLRGQILSDAEVYAWEGLTAITAAKEFLYGDLKNLSDLEPEYLKKAETATIYNKLQSRNPSKPNYVPEEVLNKLVTNGSRWRTSKMTKHTSSLIQKNLNSQERQFGANSDGETMDYSDRGNINKATTKAASRNASQTDVANTSILGNFTELIGIDSLKMFHLRQLKSNIFAKDIHYKDVYDKYKKEVQDETATALESKFKATIMNSMHDASEIMGAVDATYDTLIDRKAEAFRGAYSPDLTPVLKRLMPMLMEKEDEALNHEDWGGKKIGDNLLDNINEFNSKIKSFVEKQLKIQLPNDSDQIQNTDSEFDGSPSPEFDTDADADSDVEPNYFDFLGKNKSTHNVPTTVATPQIIRPQTPAFSTIRPQMPPVTTATPAPLQGRLKRKAEDVYQLNMMKFNEWISNKLER